MGMILTMSVSGSIIILFYILLKPLAARYFSAKWTYGLLKTAMVFYLFPFPYWNSYYIDFFCFLLKKERELSTLSMEQSIDLYAEKMIEYYPDGSIHIIAPITTWLILGIWIFIALCFFIFGLRHYCMQKKMLLLSSIVMADIRELTFTNEIKQKQHILRKVLLKESKYVKSPVTMGIINPIIVVPESIQTYGGEKELAYAHEFINIKHWDTLFKAICFVVIALHWYNPLVYYLWKELETTSEMVCDETMAVNMEKEKRVQYGNMIIDMAEAAGCQKDSFMISFSKGKGMIEERIVRLLQVKRQRGISKFLSMFLGLLIGFLGYLAVFFYDAPREIRYMRYPTRTNEEVIVHRELKFDSAN